MSSKNYLFYNGMMLSGEEKFLSPDNRSFKYGDGFFETMKMINGNIIFEDFHFDRLFSSLQTLQFDTPLFFTKQYLQKKIQELAEKNNQQSLARLRLTIFRSDGNLHDDNNYPNYVMQSWGLPSFPSYQEKGLSLNIYGDAKISCDIFANIKCNNYLPYAMAAIWCRRNGFDDALIVNCYKQIAEATTSNLFIVKDGIIKTPALSEGCVAGVTRRYLLQCFEREKIACKQTVITEKDILNADEMFLTNTGFYIQWVKQCGAKFYVNDFSRNFYQQFIVPLLKSNRIEPEDFH